MAIDGNINRYGVSVEDFQHMGLDANKQYTKEEVHAALDDLNNRLEHQNKSRLSDTFKDGVAKEVLTLSATPNFSGMSIDAIIFSVMAARSQALTDIIKDKAHAMQKMTGKMEALGKLQAALAQYGTDASTPDKVVLMARDPKFNEILTLAEQNGIKLDSNFLKQVKDEDMSTKIEKDVFGTALTQGGLAKLNETIKTMINSSTSMQSMEQTSLQDFSQKLTQCTDLASVFVKKYSDTNSGVIRNMG